MFPNMLLLLTCILSPLSSSIIPVKAQSDYPFYEDCAPYSCGYSLIRYPFGVCGLLYASCEDNHTNLYGEWGNDFQWRVIGDITNSSYSTRILQITPDFLSLYGSSNDSISDHSSYYSNGYNSFYHSTIYDSYDWLLKGEFFNLSDSDMAGTIVNCKQQPTDILLSNFSMVDCTESKNYCLYYPEAGIQIPSCDNYPVIVPKIKSYNITADKGFQQLLQRGFQISWSIPDQCESCHNTGGRCYSSFNFLSHLGENVINGETLDFVFRCICPNDDVHEIDCNDGFVLRYGKYGKRKYGKRKYGKRIISAKDMAGIFFAICAMFSIVVVSCIMVRRQSCCWNRSSSAEQQSIRAFMDPVDSRPPSVENFLNYYSSQAPARYSYNQIINYTDNLSHKVGKGGFGTVYKGKLPNGSLIAVKILDESKQSEQQFIAEVATVGTTCHINLVRLLGYCSQGSKRALIYEYMANGSLDKYIHGDHKDELDWKQLYSIAVGTARGIAYLHEACRNRILHCDIKPHNILLDDNFFPKVADFGLAKISGREESHISVANRGTLGYAAPEMWSRMYGPVTDRSDVYGYGMLVMEMVGGRKNIDLDNLESSSSKFFYAEWAFHQVENGEFGNLRKGSMSQEDQGIAKKLSLVGLWCIQFSASRRPSMSKVVQMFEGEVDITTPPFPFPVDTPMQPSSSHQSSSTNALEIQMTNPTNSQTE